MATKMPVAQERMFHNVFICRNCGKKIRSQPVRIINRTVKCPRCDGRAFKAIKKK